MDDELHDHTMYFGDFVLREVDGQRIEIEHQLTEKKWHFPIADVDDDPLSVIRSGEALTEAYIDDHKADPSAHHERYTDQEARQAIQTLLQEKADAVHGDESHSEDYLKSGGHGNEEHTVDYLEQSVFTDHSNDPSGHHTRYTDAEARDAIDADISGLEQDLALKADEEGAYLSPARLVMDQIHRDDAENDTLVLGADGTLTYSTHTVYHAGNLDPVTASMFADHESSSDAHHTRYTDAEAAAAVAGSYASSPHGNDEHTVDYLEASHASQTGAHGVTQVAGVADINSHSGQASGVHGVGDSPIASIDDVSSSITTHANNAGAHHNRYTDAEAEAALGDEIAALDEDIAGRVSTTGDRMTGSLIWEPDSRPVLEFNPASTTSTAKNAIFEFYNVDADTRYAWFGWYNSSDGLTFTNQVTGAQLTLSDTLTLDGSEVLFHGDDATLLSGSGSTGSVLRVGSDGSLEWGAVQSGEGMAEHGNEYHTEDYALASDLTSHTSSTNNPHNVTASQTGALPTSGGSVNGDMFFNSQSGDNVFYITRNGSESESIQSYIVDGQAIWEYNNDEENSNLQWIVNSNDTENSDGSNANTVSMQLSSGTSGYSLKVAGNSVYHEGNFTPSDYATNSGLTSHTGDTSNPHSVGLEQARTANNEVQGRVDMSIVQNDFIQLLDGSGGTNAAPYTLNFSGRDWRVWSGDGVGSVLTLKHDTGAVQVNQGPLTVGGTPAILQGDDATLLSGSGSSGNVLRIGSGGSLEWGELEGLVDHGNDYHTEDFAIADTDESFTSLDVLGDITANEGNTYISYAMPDTAGYGEPQVILLGRSSVNTPDTDQYNLNISGTIRGNTVSDHRGRIKIDITANTGTDRYGPFVNAEVQSSHNNFSTDVVMCTYNAEEYVAIELSGTTANWYPDGYEYSGDIRESTGTPGEVLTVVPRDQVTGITSFSNDQSPRTQNFTEETTFHGSITVDDGGFFDGNVDFAGLAEFNNGRISVRGNSTRQFVEFNPAQSGNMILAGLIDDPHAQYNRSIGIVGGLTDTATISHEFANSGDYYNTGSIYSDGNVVVDGSVDVQAADDHYHMEAAGDGSSGLVIRPDTNPSAGDPLFQVRSSGQAVRFSVDHDGETMVGDDLTVADSATVGGAASITGDTTLGGSLTLNKSLADGETLIHFDTWRDFALRRRGDVDGNANLSFDMDTGGNDYVFYDVPNDQPVLEINTGGSVAAPNGPFSVGGGITVGESAEILGGIDTHNRFKFIRGGSDQFIIDSDQTYDGLNGHYFATYTGAHKPYVLRTNSINTLVADNGNVDVPNGSLSVADAVSFDGQFDISSDGTDLVISDGSVELIRQPPAGPTQFIQGAEIGTIEAPDDTLTQLINASSTANATAGETVGYTFSLNSSTVVSVTGTADGTGGVTGITFEFHGDGGKVAEISSSGDLRISGTIEEGAVF